MTWDERDNLFIELYDSGRINEMKESDLLKYCYNGEDIYEGENRRWSQTIETVVKIKERLFLFTWERGLTECQENAIWSNPEEVKRVETEVIIPEHKEIKVEYVRVNRSKNND